MEHVAIVEAGHATRNLHEHTHAHTTDAKLCCETWDLSCPVAVYKKAAPQLLSQCSPVIHVIERWRDMAVAVHSVSNWFATAASS